MRPTWLLPLVLIAGACDREAADAPIGAALVARAAIEAGMRDSAAGWNAGDLDRFMAVYADNPATSYVAGNELIRGKSLIAARYAPSFKRGGNTRGTLEFAPLDFRMIGPDHALLIARYQLTPTAAGGTAAQGPTTLLFRRTRQGWRIVADHSG